MKKKLPLIIFALFFLSNLSQADEYLWKDKYDSLKTIAHEINTPEGFFRSKYPKNSFAHWLRYLPLKEKNSPVLLFNNRRKRDQKSHYRVIDIDIGKKDLQQCADAIIRLKSEYLYSQKKYDEIGFHFTSGDYSEFNQWIKGFRPIVFGNNVEFKKREEYDSGYSNFRKYLENIFMYSGSYSLSKNNKKINISELKSGDFFLEGGFPGHGVIIVDTAVNSDGEKIFLLAQSYMPAQSIHILVNPEDEDLSPWYNADFTNELITTHWVFKKSSLYRFK